MEIPIKTILLKALQKNQQFQNNRQHKRDTIQSVPFLMRLSILLPIKFYISSTATRLI